MFSDNEGPSGTTTANGNGAGTHMNGNSLPKGEDYDMSDDDLPLVYNHSDQRSHLLLIIYSCFSPKQLVMAPRRFLLVI